MTANDPTISAEVAPIILTLEAQLAHLDRLGAFIAAAHVDAAINKLRQDCSSGIEEKKPPTPPHHSPPA